MDNKILRVGSWAGFFISLFFLIIPNVYGEILSKPGTFDHFQIEVPNTIIAGEEFKIILYAVDAFGNPVNMPPDSLKEYRLSVTGSANISLQHIKSKDITQRGVPITIKSEKAEEVTLIFYDINSPFPLFEKKIYVVPNDISALKIQVPQTVTVGSEFIIEVSGRDKFGNKVCRDFDPKVLNIFFSGDVSPQIRDFQYNPENCIANLRLYSEKIGKFYVEAELLNKDVSGKSAPVEIINSDIAYFLIESPDEAIVDEPFEINILAVDRFKNIVKNFSTKRSKVLIEAQGKGYVFLTELSTLAFSDGKAKVSLTYNRAEEIKIICKVLDGSQIKGESNPVKINPPRIKRFEIVSPETIVAGQRFKVKVIAYNHLDKVMSNYNQYGKTVFLRSTGSGSLMPDRIPPTAFINGVAIVELMYDRAEKFEIIATVEDQVVPSEEVKVKEEKKHETPKKQVKAVKKVKEKGKKTVSRGTPLELKNISLIETKSSATLTLSIPNFGKKGGYYPQTQKKGNTMSVIVDIYPIVNKIETMPHIESDFIKGVSISEEANNIVLTIELKKPLKYRAIKKADELIIEFRRG